MFTIKKYHAGPNDYTAYCCQSYRVQKQSDGIFWILPAPLITHNGSAEPMQAIVVDGDVYIENALGKTIAHYSNNHANLAA